MRWLFLGLWLALLLALVSLVGAVGAAPSRHPLGCEAPPYPPTCTATPTPPVTPRVTIVAGGAYKLYLPLTGRVAPGWPAPPRLSVQAEPTGGFTLTWTRVPNARLYEVGEVAGEASTAPNVIYTAPQEANINVDTLSYRIPSRPPGRYTYQVASRNQLGVSVSQPVEITAPAAPDLTIAPTTAGGFTLRWTRVPEATAYTIISANTRTMSDIVETVWTPGDQTEYTFGPRAQAPLYYRVVAMTDTVGAGSPIRARPSLWGRVTYTGQPAGNIPVYLIRCAVEGSRCGNDMLLDQTRSQADGLYWFSEVNSTDPGSLLYIRFDNPTENPLYLNTWLGGRRAYSSGQIVNAGAFDIANIVLDSPLSDATVSLPTTFHWQRRPTADDRYSLTFFDGDLSQPLVLPSVGYGDSQTVSVLPTGLRPGTTYFWTVTVQAPDGGVGVGYYYRRLTFAAGLRAEPGAEPATPFTIDRLTLPSRPAP